VVEIRQRSTLNHGSMPLQNMRRREKEGLKEAMHHIQHTHVPLVTCVVSRSELCRQDRSSMWQWNRSDQFQGCKAFLQVNERAKGSGDNMDEGVKDEPT